MAWRAFFELGIGEIPKVNVLQTMEKPITRVMVRNIISKTDKGSISFIHSFTCITIHAKGL